MRSELAEIANDPYGYGRQVVSAMRPEFMKAMNTDSFTLREVAEPVALAAHWAQTFPVT